MSITITLWEDTGPVLSGHGTTRTQVTNIGWKSVGSNDIEDYAYAPITRPSGDVMLAYSYKKYNFMKIEGTYPIGSRPRIKITGNVGGSRIDGYEGAGSAKLFYKLSNTYEQPNNDWDGTLIYLPPSVDGTILFPAVSLTGPEGVVGYPQYLDGSTTYYTQYLITQLVVPAGTEADFGNIGELNIEWYMDEYEDTNV